MMCISLTRGEWLAHTAKHRGIYLAKESEPEDAAFVAARVITARQGTLHVYGPRCILAHLERALEFHGGEWEIIHEQESDRDFLRNLGIR